MYTLEEEFGPKIDARSAFERDRAVLLGLIRDLSPEEWHRPTAAGLWLVRDVVAHLLGDDLNRLSRTRDAYIGDGPRPSEALPDFIHRINQDWVSVADRLSPTVLLDLLEVTSPQVLRMWHELDLDAVGGSVIWAGPNPAPVWLDCARDFTEYWVHQQQIRDATERHDPSSAVVLHTVLDTFLRALPHTLAHHSEPDGTAVMVVVEGANGGTWSVARSPDRWRWIEDTSHPATIITCSAGTLWRLCVRNIEPQEAHRRVTIRGNTALAEAVLQIVSIIR